MTRRRQHRPCVGCPPDDLSRVRLFRALVAEYESLSAAFPAPSSFTFGATRRPTDRWSRLVRAFALRKFTLQAGEHVHVIEVADALDRLMPSPLKRLALSEESLAAQLREPIHVGEKVLEPRAIVTDMLYGVYLHGDFNRWQRRALEIPLVEEYSLYVYTVRSEQLISKLAGVVDSLISLGALPIDLRSDT